MTRYNCSVVLVLWICILSQGSPFASADDAKGAVATLYRLGSVDPFGFMDSGFVSVLPVSTIDGDSTIYEVHATEKAGTPTRTLPPTNVTSATTLTQHLTSVIPSTFLETFTLVTLGESPSTTKSTGLVTTESISFLPATTLRTLTLTNNLGSVTKFEGNTLVSDSQTIYTITEAASRLDINNKNCQFFQENDTAECLFFDGFNSRPFSTATGRLVPWYTVTPTTSQGTPSHIGASSPPIIVNGGALRLSAPLILCSGLLFILTLEPLVLPDFM